MANASPLVPDVRGRFGPYGGRYVPETLMHALDELTQQYELARQDAAFQRSWIITCTSMSAGRHRFTLRSG